MSTAKGVRVTVDGDSPVAEACTHPRARGGQSRHDATAVPTDGA
jgi:hypothetical protein